MARAAIYKRVSGIIQVEEGQSLQVQEEKLKQYIDLNDWELVQVYEDAGLSGSDTNRPAFQQMIKDAKQGKFDCIVVYKLDRLSRSVSDFHNLLEELDKYNINIIAVSQHLDTSTPTGRLLRNILIDFANFEREMIKERITDSKKELAKTGYWNGGHLPFGYKWNSNNKKNRQIIIDEDTSPIVRKVFDFYLKNSMSDKAISEKLNIGIATVRNILVHPFYAGDYVYHRNPVLKDKTRKIVSKYNWTIVPNHHPAYISKAQFDDIQEKRKDKFRVAGSRVVEQIFDKLVYCGECTHNKTHMRYNTTKGKSDKHQYKYYKCHSKNHIGDNIPINEEVIEARLKVLLTKALDDDFISKSTIKENPNYTNDVESLKKQLKVITTKISNLVNRLQDISDKSISDLIIKDIEDLQRKQREFQKEIDMSQLQRECDSVQIDKNLVKYVLDNYDMLSRSDKKRIFNLVFYRIVIYSNFIRFFFTQFEYNDIEITKD